MHITPEFIERLLVDWFVRQGLAGIVGMPALYEPIIEVGETDETPSLEKTFTKVGEVSLARLALFLVEELNPAALGLPAAEVAVNHRQGGTKT